MKTCHSCPWAWLDADCWGYPLSRSGKNLGDWRDASADQCLSLCCCPSSDAPDSCSPSACTRRYRHLWSVISLIVCDPVRGTGAWDRDSPLGQYNCSVRPHARYDFLPRCRYWSRTCSDIWYLRGQIRTRRKRILWENHPMIRKNIAVERYRAEVGKNRCKWRWRGGVWKNHSNDFYPITASTWFWVAFIWALLFLVNVQYLILVSGCIPEPSWVNHIFS